MRRRRNLFLRGIVPRLRITFCIIAAILAVQLIIGFALVRSLNNSVDDLTQSAFNTLLTTEQSERELKNLLLLLQSAKTTGSLEELKPLEAAIDTALRGLERTIAQMPDADGLISKGAQMAPALQSIEDSALAIAKAKAATLRQTNTLQDLGLELEHLAGQIRSTLEGISFDASKRTNDAIERATSENRGAPIRLDDLISSGLALANTLTTITLQLEAIFAKAGGYATLSDLDVLAAQGSELSFDFRSVVILITQLSPSDSRTELAVALAKLRTLLFDAGGLAPAALLRTEQKQTLDALLQAQLEPMTAISALSQDLNTEATVKVGVARAQLNKTTQNLTIIAALTTLVSLISIGFANFFVLERQINRRVARLTTAVLSIADGETKYDVRVAGDDELGKIACALETFKVNAEELSRSNAELEKFAYAAAHDLRSPLRAIQDLLEWTLEDTDNTFSEDSAQNMHLLKGRVERLDCLLSDLLDYSRVGQEARDISRLHMNTVVQEIADLVDPERNYDISFAGDGRAMVTYATPLRQILLNLISNSVKHHDRPKGKITVTAALKNDRIHLSVADDGPGIPLEYQERVFNLFETLKPRDEVEGSGLGLSIIRKVLDHYKGDIRIESNAAIARGTTFYFDLPEITPVTQDLHAAA